MRNDRNVKNCLKLDSKIGLDRNIRISLQPVRDLAGIIWNKYRQP